MVHRQKSSRLPFSSSSEESFIIDPNHSCSLTFLFLLFLLFEGLVHPTSDELGNAVLFQRLGLPSALIRHENGAFRKRSSNRRNLITPAFRFRVNGKHFGNGAFLEHDDVSLRQTCDFPDREFSLIINTNPKCWVIFGFFNSSSVV